MDDLQTESIQEILQQRASALAGRGDQDKTATEKDSLTLVIIRLGTEKYGIALNCIKEIDPVGDLASIPGLPQFWRGLMNQRGTLYPVLDLAAYLQIGRVQLTPEAKVVVVTSSGPTVGLLVDQIVEITMVAKEEIGPALPDRSTHISEAAIGITPDMVAILDANRLLNSPAIVVNQEALGR